MKSKKLQKRLLSEFFFKNSINTEQFHCRAPREEFDVTVESTSGAPEDTESVSSFSETPNRLKKMRKTCTPKKKKEDEFRLFFPPPKMQPQLHTAFKLHNTKCSHYDWVGSEFFDLKTFKQVGKNFLKKKIKKIGKN